MKAKYVSLLTLALAGGMTLALGEEKANIHQAVRTLQAYTEAEDLAHAGNFSPDFNSFDEAETAADELNLELCEEGFTLLKNDGTVPLDAKATISVFGISQTSGASGSDSNATGQKTILDGLTDAGFRVNPTLKTYYANHSSSSHGGMGMQGQTQQEVTSFPSTVTNSLALYDDATVVMFSRSGGEGSDLSRDTGEASDEGEHANEVTGHKHYLELSDSEESLLEYAKKQCKKVIVVLNSSYAMEAGELEDDDGINAIIWAGKAGETGMLAIGEFLAGNVNPSGRLVDVWARDFTKDPTWQNFGDNTQAVADNEDGDTYYYEDGKIAGNNANEGFGYPGYHGVDNEEGIYVAYKYYETRYKMIYDKLGLEAADNWYKENVVYPFGYGQGFSTFTFTMGELYRDSALETPLGATVSTTDVASSVGHQATIKKIYVPVTVTNTGNKAGKQTVQIYVTAPYTNKKIEKSFVTFVGFGKTRLLKPNESQTITVEVNVQDFASYDYNDANSDNNKGWELDPGEYIVRAMDSSHVELSGEYGNHPYAEKKFTLVGTAPADLKLDDFSGNEVTNKFSAENGIYDSMRENVNATDTDPMTVLSRADMGALNDSDVASFPKAPTKASRTFKSSFFDRVVKYDAYDADNTANYTDYDDPTSTNKENWAEDVNIPDTWTQAATTGTDYSIGIV